MTYLYPPREIFALAVDLNTANTDIFVFSGLPAKWRAFRFTGYGASVSLTTATIGLYSASGGGGSAVIAPSGLTALTASTKFTDVAFSIGDVHTETTLYLRNVVAQGSAATANFRLELQYYL